MCAMETQRQGSGGVTAVVAQPMSHHALPGGVAGERLTNGVRYASVAGVNRRAGTQITRGGGHYCLAWLCEPADRAARSLSSSGGVRKECFEAAEGFRGKLWLGDWLKRSVSLACACWGFVGGLISDLRERAFLRFSSVSAPAFGIAFGGACSVPAVGCSTATQRGGENISFKYESESFDGNNFISNILRRQS